jgi:hypothetical protein
MTLKKYALNFNLASYNASTGLRTLTVYTKILKRPARVVGSVRNVHKSFQLLKT